MHVIAKYQVDVLAVLQIGGLVANDIESTISRCTYELLYQWKAEVDKNTLERDLWKEWVVQASMKQIKIQEHGSRGWTANSSLFSSDKYLKPNCVLLIK